MNCCFFVISISMYFASIYLLLDVEYTLYHYLVKKQCKYLVCMINDKLMITEE